MATRGRDRIESATTRLLRLLVPPLCPGCGRAADPALPVCAACVGELNRAPALRGDAPDGLADLVSCAPHEEVARRLLAAYKFRGIIALRSLISGYMIDLAGGWTDGPIVVPVPPSRLRRRLRGFDPVELLARDLAAGLDWPPPRTDLLVRHGAGRQRGRGRAGRVGSPPDIRALPAAAELGFHPVLLVDDVVTTGTTLAVTAAALLAAGSGPVRAITFTRRL